MCTKPIFLPTQPLVSASGKGSVILPPSLSARRGGSGRDLTDRVPLPRPLPQRWGGDCIRYLSVKWKNSFAFFLLLAPLVCSACLAPKPMTNFANLKREYLDGLFLAKPHLATFMGDHRFDDRLPDLSPNGLAIRRRMLEQQKIRLKAVDTENLPLDERLDARILSDGIELELLYLNDIKEWEWEPRLLDSFPYYDPREIVATRILDILHGDFAPLEERLRSVAVQMKALPEFLAQVKSQLKNPAKIYTEQAIKNNRGSLMVFNGEVAQLISAAEGISPNLRSTTESARKIAVAALADYQRFLEEEVLRRSSGDWRLGAELFKKKFPLALQTDLTPEDLTPRAEAASRQYKLELLEVSRQLHKELFPGKPLPKPENDSAVQVKLINDIQNELSRDHPKAKELVEAHRRNLNDLRAFIEKQNIVGLPLPETLEVEPMPPFKRGVASAEYLASGILEGKAQWKATYFVDPVDPNWDPARLESYLRGNNNYEVQLTAMHEAYPGHHTQFYYSKRHLNPLRAVLWNAPFAEGWAVYGTTLMTKLGYGGSKNLRYRFFDLKGNIRMAMNALIDVKLHSGQMTEEDAVRMMVEEGFQEQADAEKKLLRAQLETTQLTQYFLGLEEIQRLENDVRRVKGKSFNQREFNETLIGHGSVPVRYLRNYFQLN